jgi:hypothetical protein
MDLLLKLQILMSPTFQKKQFDFIQAEAPSKGYLSVFEALTQIQMK